MFGRSKSISEPTAPQQLPKTSSDAEVEQLWEPVRAPSRRRTVEQLLLERGHIAEDQLDQARKVQAQTPGKSLVQILSTMNAATEAQILSAQAEVLGVGFETPQKATIDPQ